MAVLARGGGSVNVLLNLCVPVHIHGKLDLNQEVTLQYSWLDLLNSSIFTSSLSLGWNMAVAG